MAQLNQTWRRLAMPAALGALIGASRIRTDGDGAGQRRAQPVHDHREPLQAARGPHLGIDERRRHRQGRQVDLGGRALRRQLLLGPRQGRRCRRSSPCSSSTSRASWCRASAPACSSSRTASTSIATATSGSPTARTTCRAAAPGAPADAPLPPAPAKVVGHQVLKFSPDGKLLLTLGKAGGNQPGQPRGSGVVLPAERRDHLSERRHPRGRGPRQARPHPRG